MPPAPEIKGWCPSAHRPMASNDGLLIRARLIGSRIDAAQLAAVAETAAQCGNGLIDLSQRAQLQLRGVSETTLAEALRRLDAASLLAHDAEAERVNIIAAPLSGLDGAFDAHTLAQDLAAALQADEASRALPAKFLFAVDGGGDMPLTGVDADISIEPARSVRVALRIAGAGDRAVIVYANEAIATAVRLARAFVTLRDGAFELRRMKRLVAAIGLDALLAKAGLAAAPCERREKARASFLGVCKAKGASFAGVAAPSGRFDARDLAALATLARQYGAGELRVTPWRALLLPAPSETAARAIIEATERLGLIVSHDDARLAVVACPGAPECPQAQGGTRAALARFAPLAQKLAGEDGVGLHISGCAKGCARPGRAPVTLVARAGRFDLVQNGAAADAPQLQGLDIDAAMRALEERVEVNTCPTP